MAYQRVEVLTGTERRRTYTSTEKVRMVEEAFRPGVVVTGGWACTKACCTAGAG